MLHTRIRSNAIPREIKKAICTYKNTNKKQLLLTNPNHNSILYFLVNPINCFLTFNCNYAQAKCYIIHKSNKKR